MIVPPFTRRAALLGATSFATLAAASAANAAARLRVAYIPILAMAQLFVIEGEGWAKQAGLDLALTRFSSGPAMVQALVSGTFDVAYVGIGPAMVARAAGLDLKVVAANGTNQIALLGIGEFAASFATAPSPAAAFAAFHKQAGRPVRIATLPKGSVPNTVLQYYLRKVAHVAPADVQVLGVGEDRVQQVLLSGAVDAASSLEPTLTIVQSRVPSARILVGGGQMFPDQPGAVLAVREATIKANPAAVRSLVALHIRATKLLQTDPARTVSDIESAIGQGLVSRAVLLKALTSPAMHPIANPHTILAATRKLEAYQASLGSLAKPVDVDAMFDTSFYDAAHTR